MTTTSRLFASFAAAAVSLASPGSAQTTRPPVIDIHAHAVLARADTFGVRYRLMSGSAARLANEPPDPAHVIRTIGFPCDSLGRDVFNGGRCYVTPTPFPDTAWLRDQIKAGRIGAFSELIPQYYGMSPTDPRLTPYLNLAEEFDLPVGVHMGPGPPGAAYDSSPLKIKTPAFRAAYSDPMVLEEVLLRHKKLRLFVMHAGWPMSESMIALMYSHRNVYVDVGILQRVDLVPRAAYYKHLRALIEAGFAKRIMFGSDSPAGSLGQGIDAILAADFLTPEQKSDILCGNAMRFLRLQESVCRP